MMFSWDSIVNSFSVKKLKNTSTILFFTITCTVFKLLKMISSNKRVFSVDTSINRKNYVYFFFLKFIYRFISYQFIFIAFQERK